MKQHLFLLLSLAALATSCKKDDSSEPTTSSRLTGKQWSVTALTAQQGSVIEDGYADMKPCEKDNFLVFKSDNVVEMNEGVLKCDVADAQVQPGTWDLVSKESKLLITTPLFGSGAGALLDIVTLTDTQMVLRGTAMDPDLGAMTVFTVTLAGK